MKGQSQYIICQLLYCHQLRNVVIFTFNFPKFWILFKHLFVFSRRNTVFWLTKLSALNFGGSPRSPRIYVPGYTIIFAWQKWFIFFPNLHLCFILVHASTQIIIIPFRIRAMTLFICFWNIFQDIYVGFLWCNLLNNRFH
jgi:hypothetical protein